VGESEISSLAATSHLIRPHDKRPIYQPCFSARCSSQIIAVHESRNSTHHSLLIIGPPIRVQLMFDVGQH